MKVNDLVHYTDRTGLSGNWRVTGISDTGLQLKNLATSKFALGVPETDVKEPGDISAAEQVIVEEAKHKDVGPVLPALEALAAQVAKLVEGSSSSLSAGKLGWYLGGVATGLGVSVAVVSLWTLL